MKTSEVQIYFRFQTELSIVQIKRLPPFKSILEKHIMLPPGLDAFRPK